MRIFDGPVVSFSEEQFRLCEKSSPMVWMTSVDGFGVNVPGLATGPLLSALRYLNDMLPWIDDAKTQAKSLLQTFASPSGDWWPDALVIYELQGQSGEYGFAIQYSIESDLYGLWSVSFDRFLENRCGTLTRMQQ